MKGAQRVLHIRCGDDIRDKLVAAGIEGDYLSFADPAWLGPPPAFNAWLAGRAALIAERTGLPRQKVRADLGEAYWRLARAPADYGHIVLWLEHDLYDQAALVRVLASFVLIMMPWTSKTSSSPIFVPRSFAMSPSSEIGTVSPG